MVLITHVRFSGGETHAHLSEVRWLNPQTGEAGVSTRQTMVDWITKNGIARVTDGARIVDVMVVQGNPPYIRTVADGQWTDNLLSMPRF